MCRRTRSSGNGCVSRADAESSRRVWPGGIFWHLDFPPRSGCCCRCYLRGPSHAVRNPGHGHDSSEFSYLVQHEDLLDVLSAHRTLVWRCVGQLGRARETHASVAALHQHGVRRSLAADIARRLPATPCLGGTLTAGPCHPPSPRIHVTGPLGSIPVHPLVAPTPASSGIFGPSQVHDPWPAQPPGHPGRRAARPAAMDLAAGVSSADSPAPDAPSMSVHRETRRRRRRCSPTVVAAPPVEGERGRPVCAPEPEHDVHGRRGCWRQGGVLGGGIERTISVFLVIISVDRQTHLPRKKSVECTDVVPRDSSETVVLRGVGRRSGAVLCSVEFPI